MLGGGGQMQALTIQIMREEPHKKAAIIFINYRPVYSCIYIFYHNVYLFYV